MECNMGLHVGLHAQTKYVKLGSPEDLVVCVCVLPFYIFWVFSSELVCFQSCCLLCSCLLRLIIEPAHVAHTEGRRDSPSDKFI